MDADNHRPTLSTEEYSATAGARHCINSVEEKPLGHKAERTHAKVEVLAREGTALTVPVGVSNHVSYFVFHLLGVEDVHFKPTGLITYVVLQNDQGPVVGVSLPPVCEDVSRRDQIVVRRMRAVDIVPPVLAGIDENGIGKGPLTLVIETVGRSEDQIGGHHRPGAAIGLVVVEVAEAHNG